MTQEDQDRLIGQTHREHREAKQKLAALQTKARNLGERLVQIGNVLRDTPENLIFAGKAYDAARFAFVLPTPVKVEELVDLQNLLPLTDEIREMVIKVDRLRQDLIRLEGVDPER